MRGFRRTRRLGRAAILLAAAAALPCAAAAPDAAKIVVGPNMLASRDGDFPHVELVVAASPKSAKNLVGGAITYTRPEGGTANRAYASTDGGASWKASEFPEQVQWGSGDPYVAFTPQGTAIFSGLAFIKDDKGQTRAALYVYRSEDGGLTWGKGIDLGYSYDHEQITVDHTTGKYAGRIYVGVLYGPYPQYVVGIFRSEDDGKTWTGPVAAANGGGKIGINDVMPMVLSDGTLVVPYGDFEFLPDKVKITGKVSSTSWFVLSSDGGVTFGPPRKVQTMWIDQDDKAGKQLGGFPSFAADSRSKDFRDRIYAAWADAQEGRSRIRFSHSEDRGLHWSEPVLLDASAPKEAYQYQPVVAVNADGVVGVTWFDTRGTSDASQYNEYFTASLDGGKTFLAPARVSSAPSRPKGAGNLTFGAMAGQYKQTRYLQLVSAASRWVSGGDYMGLAADKDGAFHPFWSDSRTGTFQIYTASIAVVPPPSPEKSAGGTKPATSKAPPAARVKTDIGSRIEFVFDPTRYDESTKEAEIPIRLSNVSKEPIYPPLTLEVMGFDLDDPDIFKYPYPPIDVVNSPNGKRGEGAVFDFSSALGNLESLAPGAQTGPVVIKIQFTDPSEVPAIRYRLEGMVEGDK
ncbi:MAG TPA: sialidase family protein [Thermoanaerobaculia bacterium]